MSDDEMNNKERDQIVYVNGRPTLVKAGAKGNNSKTNSV